MSESIPEIEWRPGPPDDFMVNVCEGWIGERRVAVVFQMADGQTPDRWYGHTDFPGEVGPHGSAEAAKRRIEALVRSTILERAGLPR